MVAPGAAIPRLPSRSMMRGEYLAWNHFVRPENPDNGPALTALLQRIRASGRGGRIWFEPAPYKFQTAVVDVATTTSPTIELMGSGVGATYLMADGPLLSAGDLLTPGRYFHAFDMTIGATSQKTAGALVKIVGDMLVTETPSRPLQHFQFGNVSLANGFNGLHLVDGGPNLSVCGFFWEGGPAEAHGFSQGGTVFLCDTGNGAGSPHGGVVITLQNITHYETLSVADALRPAATVRVIGAADLRMYCVESFGARRGIVIDPPAGARVNAVLMSGCILGATTQDALRIAPDVAAESYIYQFNGGYVDSGGIYIGPNAKGFVSSGTVVYANSPNPAIDLDGCSGVTIGQLQATGANNIVVRARNNAKNFDVTGAMRNAGGNNGTGVSIAAGCDKYNVRMVGGEYCTTPLTAPANDPTKQASVF
jgi:hypothetical protein